MIKFPRLTIALFFWSVLVLVSYLYNSNETKKSYELQVRRMSESFFKEIVVTRAWNASHGGVYVPVTEFTQPNEYLEEPDRDVITIDSVMLTKVNPALMTRQISELAQERNDIIYHLTSLKPIRPKNKADVWEVKALQGFENGEKDLFELTTYQGKSAYRYMAPLFVDKSCLECHAKQGYKEGEIRGGISVTTLDKPFSEGRNQDLIRIAFVHFVLLILGVIVIFWFRLQSRKKMLVIAEKNKELSKLNEDKDYFFSILAHDLRGPFNGFVNLSKMLKEDYELFEDDEVKDIAGSMYTESRNISGLLVNLLEWSRVQRGKIKFAPEMVNIASIANSNIELYKDLAGDKQINFSNKIVKVEMEADKNMLDTIFRNLINNAIKFTPTGGYINLESTIEGNMIEVSISDTGVGISKDRLAGIFDTKGVEITQGTAMEKGSGLGLGLCRDFVHYHGGTISVESELEKGTTFTFRIPLRQVD